MVKQKRKNATLFSILKEVKPSKALLEVKIKRFRFPYRNLPIKGAPGRAPPLIRAPPIVWREQVLSKPTKISTVSLIIVRFPIRNHSWKA